jgi:hypothetical protein
MELATLLIFSGLDQDGACIMLLPHVCLTTSAKVVIFHVFVQAVVWNLFCNGGAERYFICFKAELCDRILWEAQKKQWRALEMLQNVYGTEAMSRATVFRWWKHFKDRNKRVVDDARSGRPSTAVTDVNIDKAEQLLKENRRWSSRKLSGILNVSLERIHHIVTVELGMSQVCARWVPRDLNDEQKRKRVKVCQRNVTLVEQNPDCS